MSGELAGLGAAGKRKPWSRGAMDHTLPILPPEASNHRSGDCWIVRVMAALIREMRRVQGLGGGHTLSSEACHRRALSAQP